MSEPINLARTYDFADFANGPLCLNCGESADHGVELGEEVHLVRRPRRTSLVAFRIDQRLLARLSDEAQQSNRSMSAVIRAALRRFLS